MIRATRCHQGRDGRGSAAGESGVMGVSSLFQGHGRRGDAHTWRALHGRGCADGVEALRKLAPALLWLNRHILLRRRHALMP